MLTWVLMGALAIAASTACSSGSGGNAAPAGLTGFGATVAAWDAAHSADTSANLQAGCCFDRVKGLGYGARDRFILVSGDSGIIDGYEENFAEGTSIGRAKKIVAQSFPSDMTTMWERKLRTCYQWQVTSPTLASILGAPKIGEPSGDVFIEFDSDNASLHPTYLADDVTDATVGLATSQTEAHASGC
jgi:hypothetical protein